LEGISNDSFKDDLGMDFVFIKSCVENKPNYMETNRGTTPTQRPLQSFRKEALLVQTKVTKRHYKVPQLAIFFDIQRQSNKSINNPRKFNTNKSLTPQSDVESFDLESFWCLVRESKDHVYTVHLPSTVVR
jgi:hypothetical protein